MSEAREQSSGDSDSEQNEEPEIKETQINEKQTQVSSHCDQSEPNSYSQEKEPIQFKQESHLKNIEESPLKIEVESPVKRSKPIKENCKPFKIAPLKEQNSSSAIALAKKILPLSGKTLEQKDYEERKVSKLRHQQREIADFYQETFCIMGVKENYLMLLNDKGQLLEFPVGILSNLKSRQPDSSNSGGLGSGGIKIGQPVRVKLEYDDQRAENDAIKFKSLQREIYEEFSSDDDSERSSDESEMSGEFRRV